MNMLWPIVAIFLVAIVGRWAVSLAGWLRRRPRGRALTPGQLQAALREGRRPPGGRLALLGAARPLAAPLVAPLVAPLSARACVYWHVRLDVWYGNESIHGEVRQRGDFLLEAPDGRVRVVGADTEFFVAHDLLEAPYTPPGTLLAPDEVLRELLDRCGIAFDAERAVGLTAREAVVEPGEVVRVEGLVELEVDDAPGAAAPAGYRQSPMRLRTRPGARVWTTMPRPDDLRPVTRGPRP